MAEGAGEPCTLMAVLSICEMALRPSKGSSCGPLAAIELPPLLASRTRPELERPGQVCPASRSEEGSGDPALEVMLV